MQFIDQGDWGSRLEYPDSPSFDPRYIIIHWGGSTAQIAPYDEPQRLRIWQRYHMDSRGWRDIAYNFAVGDSGAIYRCRGYNRGGHVSCSTDLTPEGDSYCDASLGVVWIGGANDPDGPSQAAKDSMSYLIQATGITQVKAHSTVKQENRSNTACPGDDWRAYINNKEWEEVSFDPPAPVFQEIWDKALAIGMVSEEHSDPWKEVTKQELMAFFDRAGLLEQ